jgi:hypothetical protein
MHIVFINDAAAEPENPLSASSDRSLRARPQGLHEWQGQSSIRAAEQVMYEVIFGAILFLLAGGLFQWGLPDEDWKPSPLIRVRWISVLVPTAVLCLGTAGIVLLVRGLLY